MIILVSSSILMVEHFHVECARTHGSVSGFCLVVCHACWIVIVFALTYFECCMIGVIDLL